jgi:hypothetical protein
MATKRPAKAAPVDDDDLELEELDDESTEAPAKGKKAAEDDIWGVRNGLIPLLKEKTGKDYTPREVRTLLRKMARDGGRIDREIVAGNKSRYSWEGPNDPEVKAILKAVKGGEIEAGKKEALDKLKADKAAKTAAKTEAPAKKKAKPPVDEDELEEIEDDDDE